MKKEQEMVREFMKAAGQECPGELRMPNWQVCTLRLKLIYEETRELQTALFDKDFVETADAIGDLLVVVLGTAVACGIDIEPIFNEIHRSNMTKFIDGHRREDGKWIKGPSYSPAELKPILFDQINYDK